MGTRRAIRFAVTMGLLLLLAGSAAAQDELERRLRAIDVLGQRDSEEAGAKLYRLAQSDPRWVVRERAATALGGVDCGTTTHRLAMLVMDGGPDVVRAAAATSLARRKDAVRAWKRIESLSRTDLLGRVQLCKSLGRFIDPASRELLFELLQHEEPVIRATALRALGERADARVFLPTFVEDALRDEPTPDVAVAALDVASEFDTEELRGVMPLLPGLVMPCAAARRRYVEQRFTYLQDRAEFERKKGTAYALKREPVEPLRSVLPRLDLMFAFDCTYSEAGMMSTYKNFVASEIYAVSGGGRDVRVGIVAYRDYLRDQNQRQTGWKIRAHPLSYDRDAVIAWTNELRAGGVGQSAAANHDAIRTALERMDFAPDSERLLEFVAATKLSKPDAVVRMVKLHRKEHGARVRVRSRGGGKPGGTLGRLVEASGEEPAPLPRR